MGRIAEFFSAFRKDERGTAFILFAAALPLIFGMASFAVDVGYMFYIKSRLQAAADLGALAGGTLLYKADEAAVRAKALEYVALNLPKGWGTGNNASVKIKPDAYARCLNAIKDLGLTCDGSRGANAVVVTLEAPTPLFFGNALGFRTATLSATSKVSGADAEPPPLNVAIVIDTTQSMNSTYSGSCGTLKNPTKLKCALTAVQGLLGTLWPTVDQVSLFVFPGISSGTVKYQYCASKGTVSVVSYKSSSSPTYKIVDFSEDYRGGGTPPPAGLNTGSNLAKAVGANTTCAGVQAKGGVGTFFADAVKEAQTALENANADLVAAGKKPRQNVIIILSDGDANASSSNVDSAKAANQCLQAITAANEATAKQTWVYSVAYQADNSANNPTVGNSCDTDKTTTSKTTCDSRGKNCKTTTTTTYDRTACKTMELMASDSAKFFSVGGSGGCTSATNPNTTDLVAIFKNVATSLLKMRRIPSATM